MSRWLYRNGLPAISTFSIVACDITTGELGVAVQSKFLAVGSAVPWVSADAGAVATQSWANTSFGPRGLTHLREGVHPEQVLHELLKDDPQRDERQVGIVDRQGRSATYTGSGCFDYAGGIAAPGFACQGNILAGPDVVNSMAAVYQEATGSLAERLLAALAAGQQAGGDRRGMQSAALYIAKPDGGYGGFNDRYIDLRVDDHTEPINELQRLLLLHRLYFERTRREERLQLTQALLQEVFAHLRDAGYWSGPEPTSYDDAAMAALKAYYMTENFDERWCEEAIIDEQVLAYLRKH